MKTNNLGYPRIGSDRELKKANEQYWSGKISANNLLEIGKNIRKENWTLQFNAGIDLIPSNDFSFYDQVLDLSLTLGVIPEQYQAFAKQNTVLDLYFAMARGAQKEGQDVIAMEMTKWFDTNYHYIVPEFTKDQDFSLFSEKIIDEYKEAKIAGFQTKPVIIGPVSYLLLGKEKQEGFHRIELINKLLPIYFEILKKLQDENVEYVQFDEPFLALNLTDVERAALVCTYKEINKKFPDIKIILANYFDCFGDNLETALSLPVHTLHLDLVRCPLQLDDILESNLLSNSTSLSLGVVDGRNIWKNDFKKSVTLIHKAFSLPHLVL
jgi:5-methyltetrahydropteroyltriglutamate--homocysteine methyltransferase